MNERESTGAPVYLLYGPKAWVVDEARRLAPATQRQIWLDSVQAPAAWQGMRTLLAETAALVAPAAFAALVACHRPVLAVLDPAWASALTIDERDARDALRADWLSYDSHGLVNRQPLLTAAARLIAEVVEAAEAVIVVPELAELDPQTGYALREALRVERRRLHGLCLGHDPAFSTPPKLRWGVPVTWRLEQVRSLLCDYRLCPGHRVAWLRGPGGSHVLAPPAHDTWSAPGPDTIALDALRAPGLPSASALARALSAMQWAFEAYAFSSAFQLGLALEPHAHMLDRAQQATHAAVTAIAAANLHFVDVPTPGFDEPLYKMYERATALATTTEGAASLAIRLALAKIDRGGPDAERWLDHASALLPQIEDPLRTLYHRAWLAIVAALDQIHHDDLAAADLEIQRACAALDQAEVRSRAALSPACADRLTRDALRARFIVLSHGVIRAFHVVHPLAARWFTQVESANVSPELRLDVFHWALLEDAQDNKAMIHERCRAGIRDAETWWDSRSWYLYQALAADCAYRLGRPAVAAAHLRALLSHGAFGNTGAALVGEVRSLALRALLRSGDHAAFDDAEARWLADASAPGHPEAHALKALALAMRGECDAVASALDTAIELAVEQGDHGMMLHVAVIAAQAMLRAQKDDEARQLLASAWELAEDEPGRFSQAVLPHDCVRLCVLQVRLTAASDAITFRALELLPASMSESETWWDVTELLEQAITCHRRGAVLSSSARSGLALVRRLAGNRVEWRSRLDALP